MKPPKADSASDWLPDKNVPLTSLKAFPVLCLAICARPVRYLNSFKNKLLKQKSKNLKNKLI